jgi:hypothetical protein
MNHRLAAVKGYHHSRRGTPDDDAPEDKNEKKLEHWREAQRLSNFYGMVWLNRFTSKNDLLRFCN